MTQDKKIKLSFVIPIYNAESYLEKCVNSVLDSKQENIEIILIDDGSTDKSGVICDLYSEKYINVKTIHQKNEGVASARNVGIRESSGDYLFFLDNDDWIESTKVENLLAILNKNTIDMVINMYLIVSERESSAGNNFIDSNCINNKSQKDVLEYIRKKRINVMAPWEYVVKRRILIDNSLFFDSKQTGVDDSCFTPILFCNCNSFHFNNEIIYFWRQRKDSQGKNHDKSMYILKMLSTIEELHKYIKKVHEDYAVKYLYFSIFKNIYSLFGIYNMYQKSDKKTLNEWYITHKMIIKESVKYSGLLHRLINKIFGSFYGVIVSYKLATIKGALYLYIGKVKKQLVKL